MLMVDRSSVSFLQVVSTVDGGQAPPIWVFGLVGFWVFNMGLWVFLAFFWVVIGVVWSDLWLKAHILWIASGLCIDLWFNGKIFRWWPRGCDYGGGLMVYAHLVVVLGWLVVACIFHVICHSKHLKIFYCKIFYYKNFHM